MWEPECILESERCCPVSCQEQSHLPGCRHRTRHCGGAGGKRQKKNALEVPALRDRAPQQRRRRGTAKGDNAPRGARGAIKGRGTSRSAGKGSETLQSRLGLVGLSREAVGGRGQRKGLRGKKDVNDDTAASGSGEVESGWGSRGRVGGRKGPGAARNRDRESGLQKATCQTGASKSSYDSGEGNGCRGGPGKIRSLKTIYSFFKFIV